MSSRPSTSINPSTLEQSVDPLLDYTEDDEVVGTLVGIIPCPIMIVTSIMIIFNDQCYNMIDFDCHKQSEYQRNRGREDSGYSSCLKDPRIGEAFNFDGGIDNYFHDVLS